MVYCRNCALCEDHMCNEGGVSHEIFDWLYDTDSPCCEFIKKEPDMNYKKAVEEIDKMKSICGDGKAEVKKVIAALCGEEVEEPNQYIDSTSDNMIIGEGGHGGEYKIKNSFSGYVCWIQNGYLCLESGVTSKGIKRNSSCFILVKQDGKILNGDD